MTQRKDEEQGAPVPDSEKGYEQPDQAKLDEPLTGEATERQPSWRPGGKPAGQGIYSGTQSTSTGTDEEPEGPGI